MADSKAVLVNYLMFKGKAREAMEFYQSLLGGELTIQTFGDAGMSDDPAMKDNVIHSWLHTDTINLMASEAAPATDYSVGDHSSLCVISPDEEKQTALFNGLAEGGTVTLPLEKQFWGDHFGQVTDKFGQPWMINIGELK
jgi:PhnB protein